MHEHLGRCAVAATQEAVEGNREQALREQVLHLVEQEQGVPVVPEQTLGKPEFSEAFPP